MSVLKRDILRAFYEHYQETERAGTPHIGMSVTADGKLPYHKAHEQIRQMVKRGLLDKVEAPPNRGITKFHYRITEQGLQALRGYDVQPGIHDSQGTEVRSGRNQRSYRAPRTRRIRGKKARGKV